MQHVHIGCNIHYFVYSLEHIKVLVSVVFFVFHSAPVVLSYDMGEP